MKRVVFLILVLCGALHGATETITHYSFSITSAAAADIANAMIYAAQLQANFGTSTVMTIGKQSSNDRRGVLRFEKLIDSIRTKVDSDTGVWVLDSGRVILNCAATPGTNDSLKIGMIRLKSGRLFVEGVADASTGYGVTYDSCVAKYTSTNTGIDWTTNGAAGSNDTIGGIMDSSALLGPGAPAAGGDVSWAVRTVDLVDTTNFSGWLFFPMWYGTGTTTATTQNIQWSTDEDADAAERPILNVYLTNTRWLEAGTGRRRRMLGQQFDFTRILCEREDIR